MLTQSSNSLASPVSSPLKRQLILKHEILSKDCDIFRASMPRRIYARRMMKIMVGSGMALAGGQYFLKLESLTAHFILLAVIIFAVSLILSRSIEERVLFIKGLGFQFTTVNGFGQETETFYPRESIESFYIFESFDGFKTAHFFNIRIDEGRNVILFEKMRPPVDFLRRLYRKFDEHLNN